MKAKLHTPEQVIAKLAEDDQMISQAQPVQPTPLRSDYASDSRERGSRPLSIGSYTLTCSAHRQWLRFVPLATVDSHAK
jgi:hypothetical protein